MDSYCEYQHQLIEQSQPQIDPVSFWAFCVNCLSWIGPKSLWRKTYYGLCKQFHDLKKHGQPLEALYLLTEALQSEQYWQKHTQKWWRMMRLAVMVAQDLQLHRNDKTSAPIQALMKLSLNAPQPWQGYDVAYCFVSFSLWSFQYGKMNRALNQVQHAIHADPSWGYPEYLLGWYGLHLEGIDSVDHFVKAIRQNWGYLARIKQDPICQAHPQIVQAVKRLILAGVLPDQRVI